MLNIAMLDQQILLFLYSKMKENLQVHNIPSLDSELIQLNSITTFTLYSSRTYLNILSSVHKVPKLCPRCRRLQDRRAKDNMNLDRRNVTHKLDRTTRGYP
jgi:hypothetical protein